MLDESEHFQRSNPKLFELFNIFKSCVVGFGRDISVTAVKSAILFKSKSVFVSLIIRKDYLLMEFYADHVIDEFPILKHTILSKNRILHELHLYSPSDLTSQVKKWINDSHLLIES